MDSDGRQEFSTALSRVTLMTLDDEEQAARALVGVMF